MPADFKYLCDKMHIIIYIRVWINGRDVKRIISFSNMCDVETFLTFDLI